MPNASPICLIGHVWPQGHSGRQHVPTAPWAAFGYKGQWRTAYAYRATQSDARWQPTARTRAAPRRSLNVLSHCSVLTNSFPTCEDFQLIQSATRFAWDESSVEDARRHMERRANTEGSGRRREVPLHRMHMLLNGFSTPIKREGEAQQETRALRVGKVDGRNPADKRRWIRMNSARPRGTLGDLAALNSQRQGRWNHFLWRADNITGPGRL
ncbi:hypothetical protein NDU88_000763 [Pleurodeles waltl]|uniref:Uncharacterized protein n=1 Tax=Pleurodeles waltl TaxID=8319 RepID=A0AAV7WGE9_PLEWA|nr:hypothetical protein NDU88_000763 [Pleurodeles waltl]